MAITSCLKWQIPLQCRKHAEANRFRASPNLFHSGDGIFPFRSRSNIFVGPESSVPQLSPLPSPARAPMLPPWPAQPPARQVRLPLLSHGDEARAFAADLPGHAPRGAAADRGAAVSGLRRRQLLGGEQLSRAGEERPQGVGGGRFAGPRGPALLQGAGTAAPPRARRDGHTHEERAERQLFDRSVAHDDGGRASLRRPLRRPRPPLLAPRRGRSFSLSARRSGRGPGAGPPPAQPPGPPPSPASAISCPNTIRLPSGATIASSRWPYALSAGPCTSPSGRRSSFGFSSA